MRVIKDNYIYSFDAAIQPYEHVSTGEVFAVQTKDCYGGAIKTEEDLRKNFPDLKINGATGPIYVKGIKKGEMLAVEILKIDIDKQGVMVTQPRGGILGDHIKESQTRILPIYNNYALLAEQIKIPLNKMIGVIGTAPEGEPIKSEEPGDHGGNLDTKDITEGSILYLPAFHDGGLLALGDLHAAMGDGELNGTGIEIGGQVILRVCKRDDLSFSSPVVETESEVILIYSDKEFNEAVRGCMIIAIEIIMERHGLKFADAYRLLSVVGDIKISQLVNPKVTVRIALPKSIIQL